MQCATLLYDNCIATAPAYRERNVCGCGERDVALDVQEVHGDRVLIDDQVPAKGNGDLKGGVTRRGM